MNHGSEIMTARKPDAARARIRARSVRHIEQGKRWLTDNDETIRAPSLVTSLPQRHAPTVDAAAARENCLLRSLPEQYLQRLLPHLERVDMPFGRVLYESGTPMHYVHFPVTSIVSLLYVMADGASTEVGVVGNEGMVGVALFMGGGTTPSRAVVQSAGYGFRLRGRILREEFAQATTLQHALLRYTHALLTQMSQTAVCNRHHSVDQQLCRRLLLSLDRLPSNQIDMTQELIANMLGVRREGITEAAGKLQHAGLIKYCRGHITVLDRARLEAQACECYRVVKGEFDRLLADMHAD